MNWLEKIRDNFIPIQKLYSKFFYSDRVASLLLRIPLADVNQETSLVFFMQKGFSKYQLLKAHRRQQSLEVKIHKAMNKFRVYNPQIKQYVQTVRVKFGTGIEYLLLGEILERDYGFNFESTPEEIMEDGGKYLCSQIEAVMNRIGAYFTDKKKSTLISIKKMIQEENRAKRLEDE